jgi:hypothetical protein
VRFKKFLKIVKLKMTDNENTPAQDLISLNWKEAAKKYGEDFGEHT